MLIGRQEFDFSRKTYIMGILNVTPDSFSDGGLYLDPGKALDRALQMQEEGADIIDLGGESSRPGSEPVSADEELERVLPVLKVLVQRLDIPVSIDTYKSPVAKRCLEEGAALLNDITAMRDPGTIEVLLQVGAPVILMHMKGLPKTMQQDIFYEDVVSDVVRFLGERIAWAAERGLDRDRMLIDPGIGFGKRPEDNLYLLNRLSELKVLGRPIVFGASRKSFIRKIAGGRPEEVLAASVATAALAADHGASFLRVHDVRETKSAIRLVNSSHLL